MERRRRARPCATSSSCGRARRCGRRRSTRIRSASRTVEMRCETMSDVRCAHERRAAAAESPPRCACPRPTAHRRGSGCADRCRARARCAVRCFCPPDSVMPRSPTRVSYPCGKSATSLSSRAIAAASSTVTVEAASLQAGLSRPGFRPAFAAHQTRRSRATVSENRNGSCGTKPIAPRTVASGSSRTSTPSMNTVPGGGSCSRASSDSSVDLPEPVRPTIATVCPAANGHVDVAAGLRASPYAERQVPQLDCAA